jgi:hypothetical protein
VWVAGGVKGESMCRQLFGLRIPGSLQTQCGEPLWTGVGLLRVCVRCRGRRSGRFSALGFHACSPLANSAVLFVRHLHRECMPGTA